MTFDRHKSSLGPKSKVFTGGPSGKKKKTNKISLGLVK